ncbi:MAG: hypothetical protein WBV94_10685 [Blastocatellia bacterium]
MKKSIYAHEKTIFALALLKTYAIRLSALVAAMILLTSYISTFHTRAQDSYTGQWIIEPERASNQLQLTLTYSAEKSGSKWGRGSSITSFGIAPEQLRGLTQSQMMAAGSNVQFQLVRDAGTFNCEGWFKQGKGSGHFQFASNAAFVSELRKRNYESPTEAQLFSLAMNDVGVAFIEELRAQGYDRHTLDQLVRMGDHGVSLEYLRELKAQGYTVQSVELVTRMVDHGVSISFVREMDALGYKHMPVETLIRTVDHGVTPGFIKELESLGHSRLPLEQLTRLVDHGVGPRFIKEIEEAGYGRPSLDQLVRMQDHGVSARFIKKMKSRGFDNVTIEELIKLADNGMGN